MSIVKLTRYRLTLTVGISKNIQSLCQQYQVQSYPTIKFFGFDAKENLIEEEFDGDHHWEDIQDFYEDVKNPSGSFLRMYTQYVFEIHVILQCTCIFANNLKLKN